jgi:hypothetical protein
MLLLSASPYVCLIMCALFYVRPFRRNTGSLKVTWQDVYEEALIPASW